jgi:CheY-like chemotaxis protein
MKLPLTILYADDDPDDIAIFNEVLRDIDQQIKCISASNGLEALTLLTDSVQLPDIIFLDINMPQMSGKDCLTKIRSNSRLARIPVIMYSTAASDEEIAKCYKLGATDYLVKASNFSKLREDFLSIFENLSSNKVYKLE